MEGLQVEYKVKLSDDVLDGFDTVVASFANAKGGEIWFGVDNQGNTLGAQLTDVERQRLAQRAARCRPPALVDFEDRTRDGKPITVVRVPESTSIHSDTKERVPIRIGGITSYLDVSGILLLARERGLEFPTREPGVGMLFRSPPRGEPPDLPAGLAEHFLQALRSSNPHVRVEILKDLERLIYHYRIEKDAKLMELLTQDAVVLSETLGARPFDMLKYLLSRASSDDQRQWVPLVREGALAVCKNYETTRSASAIQQAMSFLGDFPHLDDLALISTALSSWPKELYAQARPSLWLEGLKRQGHFLEVNQMLMGMLEKTSDPEKVERIKESLDQLRRM